MELGNNSFFCLIETTPSILKAQSINDKDSSSKTGEFLKRILKVHEGKGHKIKLKHSAGFTTNHPSFFKLQSLSVIS